MSRRKLNLTARVAKVFRAVKKLERRGHNPTDDYDYTRATDVFEEVRDRLFADGILMNRDEAEPVYVDKETNSEGWLQECRLRVTYSFTDGESTTAPERCNGVARKVNSDKALYTAQTGADKAFLKRKGLMAEVIDDPEFSEPASETLDDTAPMRTPRKEKPLAAYQIENIREAAANTGKTDEQLLIEVSRIGHAAELVQVKQKHFKALFTWASDGRGTVSAPKQDHSSEAATPRKVAANEPYAVQGVEGSQRRELTPGTSAPKPPAAPDQGALPLRAAPAPIQMKIGAKGIEFEPKEKGYAL